MKHYLQSLILAFVMCLPAIAQVSPLDYTTIPLLGPETFLAQSLMVIVAGAGPTGGSGGGTFSRIQAAHVLQACTGGGHTCTMTIGSTGTGHLLHLTYIGSGIGGNWATTLAAVTGGGTWVPNACHAADTFSNGAIDMGYVLSSTSGTTILNITLSTDDVNADFMLEEYAKSGGGSISLHGTCQVFDNHSSSATPLTAPITTTVGNTLVTSAVEQNGFYLGGSDTVTNVQGTGWTTPAANPGHFGSYSDNLNPAAATQQASFVGYATPQPYAASTLAFE